MRFDPYLSPPFLDSPVSAPAIPPISAPAVDWEKIAAQRAAGNDALRAQNAQLTRSLAAANMTIAKLKSLSAPSASSIAKPFLPPSRPPGSLPLPPRATRAAPSTTMEPEKKQPRARRDVFGNVHQPDDSPSAPPPAASPPVDPILETMFNTPEDKRRRQEEYEQKEARRKATRSKMPGEVLWEGVGEGSLGEVKGWKAEEKKKVSPVLGIEAEAREEKVEGEEGKVEEKEESGGEQVFSGVVEETEGTKAKLDAENAGEQEKQKSGGEKAGEKVSPKDEKKAEAIETKPEACSAKESEKQGSRGEDTSPPAEKTTPPIEETADGPPAKSSPKRKSASEDDEDGLPRKKVKTPPASPFAGCSSPRPSPFAAPTASPFGAPNASSFGSGSSSFGTGSSFAPAGLTGASYTYAGHVIQWSKSFTAFFENHDPDLAFPSPPTSACRVEHCSTTNADRALEACPHATMKALRVLLEQEYQRGGRDGRKAWFKKMRTWWHPDRVATLATKEKKEKWEAMAKEVFCEVGNLMEEIEQEEKQEDDKKEQGKGGAWWTARK